jgi:hypothetical protein
MRTIWKFEIAIVAPGLIRMPKGAEILTVQTQHGVPCVWAIVDPQAEKEDRYFEILGTGQPVYEGEEVDRAYVGTFQQPPFVWHLFERLS